MKIQARLIQDGRINKENIYGEMGEIVAGQKPGRETENEIVLACLIGLGSHDVCCAKHVYDVARKKGIGQFFNFQQSFQGFKL